MPVGSKHPCTTAFCPTLVPRGQAKCEVHRLKAEQDRGSAHERGYTARWRAYRLGFLQRNPLCVLCLGEGRTVPATVVDHVSAHKGDDSRFWDPTNHRALCKPHHDARTDEGDFGR